MNLRTCLGVLPWAALLLPGAALAQGASARLSFDAADQALNGGAGYQTSDNKTGTLAWGESYVMMGYAAMYRATGDPSYLVSLAAHARSVLQHRDDVLGWKDYAGQSRPCWQSTKYSDDQEPFCWVVHSGMITYPMADLARLVGKDPALQALGVPWGGTLGESSDAIVLKVDETVATHEFEWASGPASGEGHYIGDPSAPVASVKGKALPLNQMNAMGMTLAALADTGRAGAEAKAKQLCAYLRHRMTLSGGRMVWTYWGDAWASGSGEDISHGALNVEFASLCHARGWYFTQADMEAIARTLFENVHVDTDTAHDKVDGTGDGNTYRTAVGRWLTVAPFDPRVWPVGANAYRKAVTSPNGADLHSLALVALHAPPLREFSFYSVDWQDLGGWRKATARGANVLALPADRTQRFVFRLDYKAARATGVQQWDGTAYHSNLVLAPAAAADLAFVPYDPAIYMAYSGDKALFQFDDAFVAGQGVEVKEPAALLAPEITTASLPGVSAGETLDATLQGTGDPPLLWSVDEGPAGAAVGLQTGRLTWTSSPADAPSASFTLRLRNDSGSAIRTFTVAVGLSQPPDAGGRDAAAVTDASQPDSDAATEPADAARPDSDGGTGRCPATAGGCGCSTASSVPAVWLAFAVLALGTLRRTGARTSQGGGP